MFRALSKVWTIARREFAAPFDSPLAYVVLPLFLGLVGAFALWFQDLFATGVATVRPVFTWTAVGFLFLAPALSMRLFAEEWRSGSMELLATLPVTETEIVLGKYLGALGLLAVALLLTLPYPLAVSAFGELDWGPVVGGYAGLLALGAADLALGTAASALSSSQLAAFLLSFTACALPFALGSFLDRVPPALLPLAQALAFDTHFSSLARGVLDSRDLLFYASVVAVGLGAAVLALSHRRLA